MNSILTSFVHFAIESKYIQTCLAIFNKMLRKYYFHSVKQRTKKPRVAVLVLSIYHIT